ncbi:DUF6457 domain-containing protein [uncultured Leifsonia sp.]|uniref:DUF6457 domain-containing protein n=1 Tax=uncultured Leifsonia sp. TaxID=340359 RepID=UPI0028D55C1E|nr:DUF6457 domain-containing protein [uncultured Leifsonia sp.]
MLRPAAPLSAFVVGYAAGRAGTGSFDVIRARARRSYGLNSALNRGQTRRPPPNARRFSTAVRDTGTRA